MVKVNFTLSIRSFILLNNSYVLAIICLHRTNYTHQLVENMVCPLSALRVASGDQSEHSRALGQICWGFLSPSASRTIFGAGAGLVSTTCFAHGLHWFCSSRAFYIIVCHLFCLPPQPSFHFGRPSHLTPSNPDCQPELTEPFVPREIPRIARLYELSAV